jgi:hypothetical protein
MHGKPFVGAILKAGLLTAALLAGLATEALADGIAGTIRNATTSAAVSGVTVSVFDSNGTLVTSPSTDEAGIYTTGSLPTGSYFARTANVQGFIDQMYNGFACFGVFNVCNIFYGTRIAVTAGATTTIDFALAPAGRISGTVTNVTTSAALSEVAVEVYDSTGAAAWYGSTNAAGVFTTSGLPPGSYFARTINGQGLLDQLYNGITCFNCIVTTGTPIAVTAEATTTINFALAPGGRISGMVTNATTGDPVRNVEVELYTSTGTFVTSTITVPIGAYTGAYTIGSLPTGSYLVRTSNLQGFVDQLYNGITCFNCSVTTGTPIAVTAGATTTINFALVPGGRLSGAVTSLTTSTALGGITVQVYTSTGAFLTSASTDAAGVYTTTGLPGGTYYARTFNSQGLIDQLYNGIECLSCNVTAGTPIAVTVGATTRGINFALAGLLAGDIPIAADFDGDGKRELTVFRPSTGEWFINGSVVYQWGLPGDIPIAADFDGDGKTDLTVFRPSTGTWYIRYSSLGYSAANSYQWGLPGDIPIAGDFDGDGKTELTVWRPSDGTWYIRYSSLGYSAANTYQWGLPGDIPIAGDFDGDGKTELTVWRPSDGTWYLRYSSLGYNAANTYQWGLPGDIPIAGDFDGDGKTELTVWRPSDGTWYLRYSSFGYSAANTYQWGLPGDIPVTGDFDGDRRSELVVFRPSNSTWYISYSSLGYQGANTFQW